MTRHQRGLIAAVSVLGVAAVLFGTALARALTVEPIDYPEPPSESPADEPADAMTGEQPRVPSEATLSPRDIALAVDNDPFLPDRTRPEPYRLPGEFAFETEEAPAAPPVPHFQVTGTVVADGGGLAVLQVDDSPPQVLSVGESLLGWKLDAVGANTATMVNSTGRILYLSLASGPPQRAQADEQSTNRAFQFINPQVLRSLEQRFGEGFSALWERAQRSGADQRAAQAILQQLLQQSGRGRGGNNMTTSVRIRRDTTDVPLRTPDHR